MKPLIVGIDPGTTSAAAGVDFEGDLEFIFSERHISTSELIEEIISYGRPVIITSDKGKTPSKVEKIATSLGARLYEPEKDLSQREKSKMGKGDNYHELDASAAALNAFNNSRKEIRKINELASEADIDLFEASKRYYGDAVIREDENLDKSRDQDKSEGADDEKTETLENRLRRKIDRLETRVAALKQEKEDVKQEKENLQDQIDRVRKKNRDDIESDELRRKDSLIARKDSEIKSLEESLESSIDVIKAYRQGVKMLFEGSELIPIADEIDELGEKAAFRSEKLKEDEELENVELIDVEKIKGLELKDFIIAEDLPEKNFKDVIRDYRESR